MAKRLIDAHVHVFPPALICDTGACLADERFAALYDSPNAKMATAEDVLIQMDECGIDKSVIFGFAFDDVGLCRQVNDYVLGAVKEHPDRLAGLACVPTRAPFALGELERCLDEGMRGCGELAPVSADHEQITRLAPIAECLRERHLPLVIHASEPVGHQYPGKGRFTPEACVSLAQAYPGLTMVLSHLGGGVVFYELMPEIKKILVDVHYDTAALPYLYEPNSYEVVVRAAGREKLLFGSDYPLVSPTRCAEGLERLSGPERAAVGHDNAQRVFAL